MTTIRPCTGLSDTAPLQVPRASHCRDSKNRVRKIIDEIRDEPASLEAASVYEQPEVTVPDSIAYHAERLQSIIDVAIVSDDKLTFRSLLL